MNEAETAIYNYHYAKEGREAAQKYLDSIQESLNTRTAEDLYGTVSGDAGLEILFGAAASVEGFEGGVRSAFNFKDDHIAKTPHRIASSKVREDLSDVGPKLPGWLGGGSLGQLAYDAVGAAAYMAPSVLVSYATGIPMAGNALMGIGAAGGAYRQALNEGYDRNQARGYGLLTGMAETALEKFLGGISAYGGNRLGKKAVQNLANVDDALKMLGGKLGGSMLGEFREEYLQEVLDPVIRHITLKTEEEMNLLSPDALYSGFLGALLGPGIESVDAVVNGLPVEFNDIDTPSEKALTPTIDDAEMDAIFEGIEDLDGWKRLKSLPKAEQERFIETLFDEESDAGNPDGTDEWLFAGTQERDSFSADARDKLTKIVRNGTIKLQRGFMCFPENDPLVANSKNVVPKEGFFDVAMHGSPTAVGFGSKEANMSPRLLANVIRHREDYHGENIRLLSCSTGLIEGDRYCFAEELANALGVIVEAPNMKVYTYPNGTIKVGWLGEGKMIAYSPNERGRIAARKEDKK